MDHYETFSQVDCNSNSQNLDCKYMKPFKLNQNGLSLVEAMVTIGIIAISAIATMTLTKSNLNVQRQNRLINTFQSNHVRIQHLIKDQASWEATIDGNASMACLKAPMTPCPAGTNVFDLYDASTSTTPRFYSLNASNSGSRGFSEGGAVCNTHASGGSADCPIAYRIEWAPQCPGGAYPCVDPSIQINVVPFYRPADNGSPVNVNNYSITGFIRTASGLSKSFYIEDRKTGANGGGACSGTVQRTFNEVTTPANSDPYGLVNAGGGTNFVINEAGTYRCTASAVGFAVGTFQIRLVRGATVYGRGSGFAPDWIQGSALLEATFTIPQGGAPWTMSLEQQCFKQPGGTPNADIYALGLPTEVSPGTYAPFSVFSTVSCTKTN